MSNSLIKKNYKYVLVHKKWNPKRRQVVPFYDRVFHSIELEYRGRVYCGLLLDKDHHYIRLRNKGRGWEDITKDYTLYLQELEDAKKPEPEEPVKRKRGRPKKNRD